MKTSHVLAATLFALTAAAPFHASSAPLPANSLALLFPPANRIVGTWDYPQVNLFRCDTGQPLAQFRAASVFNAGGTMLDTNTTPPTTRSPAFGTWTFDLRSREYTVHMRLYRYKPDGSFAGTNQIRRVIKLSADGNQSSETTRSQILGPNDEVLFEACGEGDGVRSL